MTIFVRIVEAGSLTGAAERLGCSLTAVVRSLAALEEALGARLINRSTRRMALTAEGRDYFERCRRLLAEVEEAEAVLTDRRREPSGRLVLTAPVMFGRLHVAPVVTDFLAAYPAVRAELVLLDRIVDLLEEGIDLAVRIGPLPDSALVARPVGSTRRVLCATPEYLKAHGTPEHPRGLARHRLIRFTGLDGGQDWVFQRGAETVRVPVADVFACNHVDVAVEACTKGLGCGRFLAYQVRRLLDGGQLVRLLPQWEPEAAAVSIVYPHSRLLSPRIRAFVDWAVPRLHARLGE